MVSVILTAYNHEKYIKPALESIRKHTYRPMECIVVDNGSTDKTANRIIDWKNKHPDLPFDFQFIFRKPGEMGYCASFNDAFSLANGDYFIDMSADDLLLEDHLGRSVEQLKQNIKAACCFSDIWLLDEKGNKKTFYKRDKEGTLLQKIKIGNLYKDIVARYILPSASLVFDANAFRKEGGYDEYLSYEDFDIMVRLSRNYQFVFSNHIGITKRIHQKAYSNSQYQPRESKMLQSTLEICQKIKKMNIRPKEDRALLERVLHELKHALWSGNFEVARGFLVLAEELQAKGIKLGWYKYWSKMEWDFSGLYLLIKKINLR